MIWVLGAAVYLAVGAASSRFLVYRWMKAWIRRNCPYTTAAIERGEEGWLDGSRWGYAVLAYNAVMWPVALPLNAACYHF